MATTSESQEALPNPLEKATVWYRCDICRGYLYSIPELKKHAAIVHQKSSIKLPENLPPGAENGKIYYTYNLPCNKPPPPYPYEELSIYSLIAESDYYSTRCKSKPTKALTSKSTNAPEQIAAKISSPPDRDYGIRVRQLEELQDVSSGEEENLARNVSPGSIPRTPVSSPPDSGIQMYDAGSELQEDEGHPYHPARTQLATRPTPPPNNAANNHEPLPSTSTAPQPTSQDGKIQCNNCYKKFNNVSSLNFHRKKFHPNSNDKPKEPVVRQLASPSEKVILTIHRDVVTGNLISSSSKNQAQVQEIQNAAIRVRNPSPSGSESGTDTQTVFLPRKKQSVVKESPGKKAENNKASSTKSANAQKPETKNATSRNDNVSLAESDDDDIPPRNTRKRRIPITPSESEHSEFEISPSKKKVLKKKTNLKLRSRRKQAKPQSDSDSSSSPIARKTRSRVSKLKSPTPSSSESESHSESASESENNDDKDEEGELSDRSTTSSEEDSLPPPSLTNYGGNNETQSKKKNAKEDKRVENFYSSGSDSSDLFTEIKVKRPKVKKGGTGSGSQKDGTTSEKTKEVAKTKKS